MNEGFEENREVERYHGMLARLGVSIPRPRLDAVRLAHTVESFEHGPVNASPAEGESPSAEVTAPVADSAEAEAASLPQEPAVEADALEAPVDKKPPTAPPPTPPRNGDGNPPPLRADAKTRFRTRTKSGRFRPVFGAGGPEKALEGGRPTRPELVSKGETVYKTDLKMPQDEETHPIDDIDDDGLAEIMGSILATEANDEKRRANNGTTRVSRENWFEDVFEADTWIALQPETRDKDVARELRFVHEQVGIRTDFKVLDVGCADGKHALTLATMGCDVTAMDLSYSLLEHGLYAANEKEVPIRFVEADMRELNFEPHFDLILCMNTTFGYFDDAENLRVLRSMARALKPGGHLILDVVNRDWLLQSTPQRAWWETGDRVILEEIFFEPIRSRLEVQRSIMRDGDPNWEQNMSIRSYALHELPSMMQITGLNVVSVTGDLAHPCKYLGPSNRRLIFHARRDNRP